MARFPPPPPRFCFTRFQISQFADLSPTSEPPQSLIAAPTAREDLSAAPPTIFDTDNGTEFPLVQDQDFSGEAKRISMVTKKVFSSERLNSNETE